jgi:hypothetical protein
MKINHSRDVAEDSGEIGAKSDDQLSSVIGVGLTVRRIEASGTPE